MIFFNEADDLYGKKVINGGGLFFATFQTQGSRI